MPSHANGYTRSKIFSTFEGMLGTRNAVEAIAAGDEVAFQHLLCAAGIAEAHARRRAVDAVQGDVLHFETDRPAGRDAGGDQVLHHFLLAVDGDRMTGEPPADRYDGGGG